MTNTLPQPTAMRVPPLSHDAVGAIDRNIDGAFDFLQAIVANTGLVDEIPDGTNIVLEYEDDPCLTALNRNAAARAQRAGHRVYTHHVRRQK